MQNLISVGLTPALALLPLSVSWTPDKVSLQSAKTGVLMSTGNKSKMFYPE